MGDTKQVTCPECGGEMDTTHTTFGEQYYCFNCGHENTLTESKHVRDQWEERSRCPRMYPISGWENGFVVPKPHGMEAEELRYHHPSRQAVIRKRTTLVTSIDVTSARYTLKKAVIREMIKRGHNNAEIAELVRESNIGRDGLEKIARETSRADRGTGSASTASAGTDTPGRQRTQ